MRSKSRYIKSSILASPFTNVVLPTCRGPNRPTAGNTCLYSLKAGLIFLLISMKNESLIYDFHGTLGINEFIFFKILYQCSNKTPTPVQTCFEVLPRGFYYTF